MNHRSIAIAVSLLSINSLRAVEPISIARLQELEARPIHKMRNVDLAEYLALRSENAPSIDPADAIRDFATRSVGQTYRLNAVRFDMAEGDCVTFVERNIALSLSRNWAEYQRLSERLRHKDGVVEYRNRNFFTLGDWVPNNSWLLEDITHQLGPRNNPVAQPFTFVVRPKVFEEMPAAPGSKFTRTVFKGSDYRSGVKELRQGYFVPRDKIATLLPDLRTGDVFCTMVASHEGTYGCDHLGIVVRSDSGEVTAVHSTPPRVKQQELLNLVERFERIEGLMFMRLRNNARQLVEAELERHAASIPVLAPIVLDQKVQALRRERKKRPAGLQVARSQPASRIEMRQ